MRKYRLRNREKRTSYNRAYSQRKAPERRLYAKEHYRINRERILNRNRVYNQKLKEEILTYYNNKLSPECVVCGEKRTQCLLIDHIKGDGYIQRRVGSPSAGSHFYRWLKKQGFPEGYQTLCMNCQWIKKFANKEFGNVGDKFLPS